MLERCLELQRSNTGAIDDDDVDKSRLELLEAQLPLAELLRNESMHK